MKSGITMIMVLLLIGGMGCSSTPPKLVYHDVIISWESKREMIAFVSVNPKVYVSTEDWGYVSKEYYNNHSGTCQVLFDRGNDEHCLELKSK